MNPRNFIVILVLLVCALIAFGSTINGELIAVDDPGLIKSLQAKTTWNLRHTFVRHNTTGLYYRPLTGLSFTADKLLWDADLRAMHLVNIVLHTLNALLVFFLTRFLFGSQRHSWHLSLGSAVLFLCHPLAAESVNWISGRTDILSATFVFGSALAVMQFNRNKHWGWMVGAICLAGFGLLAKETAIAFIAGFGFLLWACECPVKLTLKNVLRRGALLCALIMTSGGVAWTLLFAVRKNVLRGGTSHIATTLRIMDADWYHSLFVCLRAFGFYVKKIFFPLPLNFAILEVDPLYELLAIPVLLLLVFLFIKRSLAGGYVLTGAALLSPAFPIAFNQIAWAPYAERYVYLALGFVVPAVIYYGGQLKINARYIMAGVFTLALLFLSVTAHRSLQWSTNETLWADTVKKSPLSEKASNNYGVALCQQGRYDEAEVMFRKAAQRQYSSYRYNDKYDINMAVAMIRRKDFQTAQDKLLYAIEHSKGASSRAVDVFIEITEKQPNAQKDYVVNELRAQLLRLAEKTGFAGYYYQLGRLEKHVSDENAAYEFFKKAHSSAKEPDPMLSKASRALEAYSSYPEKSD